MASHKKLIRMHMKRVCHIDIKTSHCLLLLLAAHPECYANLNFLVASRDASDGRAGNQIHEFYMIENHDKEHESSLALQTARVTFSAILKQGEMAV